MANKFPCAVLFYVDGTLIDSTYFHALSWWQAFRQSGRAMPTARIHRTIGMGGQELVKHFLGPDVRVEQIEKLIGAHDSCPRIGRWWFPSSRRKSCWNAVRRRAPPWFWHPRRNRRNSTFCARHSMLKEPLRPRPALPTLKGANLPPDILAAALDAAGVETSRAIFVGDSIWDAKAAVALGLPMIGVCSGGTSAAELRDAGAAEVYQDVQELLENVPGTALGRLLYGSS